jgi:hypothetical protein
MLRPVAGARKMNGAPDDTWGQHLADVNIGLGDLIDVVRAQTRTHLRARR